jgi:hypothetical protein
VNRSREPHHSAKRSGVCAWQESNLRNVPPRGAPPPLEQLLANVVRGRVAYLCLTPAQKRQFYDRDGKLALDVLRHLLGARADHRGRFPLTEGGFQAVARRLGHEVGQKRSRALVKRLRAAGVTVGAGQYRQPYRDSGIRSGFRVALHRLGRLAARPVSKAKRPVGTPRSVKSKIQPRWWRHPLFGDICGLPPPEIPRPTLRRMRSLDECFQSPR